MVGRVGLSPVIAACLLGAAAAAWASPGGAERDPFRSPIGPRSGEECPWQLGAYDAHALKLVAIIEEARPRAMVEDAQGLGFSIGLGTKIGCPGGVVTTIAADRVVLREERPSLYDGETRSVEVVLKLRPEEKPAR